MLDYNNKANDAPHRASRPQAGQVVGDGNRGKAIAIGPFVRYYGKGWGITFKWQHETEVANRAKGERFYLQAMVRL